MTRSLQSRVGRDLLKMDRKLTLDSEGTSLIGVLKAVLLAASRRTLLTGVLLGDLGHARLRQPKTPLPDSSLVDAGSRRSPVFARKTEFRVSRRRHFCRDRKRIFWGSLSERACTVANSSATAYSVLLRSLTWTRLGEERWANLTLVQTVGVPCISWMAVVGDKGYSLAMLMSISSDRVRGSAKTPREPCAIISDASPLNAECWRCNSSGHICNRNYITAIRNTLVYFIFITSYYLF